MNKRKDIMAALIAFASFVLLTFGRAFLNPYIFALSVVPANILNAAAWWLSLTPVLLLMRWDKTKIGELGFMKEKLPLQILMGVASGLLLPAAMIGAYRLFGVLDFMMGNGHLSIPMFLGDTVINIATVGFVEEFVFRGYIFKKLLDYKDNRLFAVLLSSVLFGLFHIVNILGGNPLTVLIQIGMTTVIGLIFCLFREKIPRFSLVSLIILHGMYDAALPLFTALFQA